MGAAVREILLSPRPAEQVNVKEVVIRLTVFGVAGPHGLHALLHVEKEQMAHKRDQESSNKRCKTGGKVAAEKPARLGCVDDGLTAVGYISLLSLANRG